MGLQNYKLLKDIQRFKNIFQRYLLISLSVYEHLMFQIVQIAIFITK
jgi:hypothetical protein